MPLKETASSFFTKAGVERQNLGNSQLYHIGGGGCAYIIAPDGRIITSDLGEEEEGLLIADGHYSRPDLLWLGVDNREKLQKRTDFELLTKIQRLRMREIKRNGC
ncbi:hypothetical protein PFICI_12156 [Pestalotiopsis fici W106-1]|uniref:CN hydrolase domain-containing protein n=1 Tax=Pestalotiopsis fici (strain W106-1 / CGMCC3.15140) TaxID=1229662 RepID=W3WSJ2_PESFW|nr:uncharacterized protein PFICI_12156 [Pestalotiopsis fici W106-1]ETS76769.1 hypothetical protein PFICI_12156 [Pestalotiopsis fici W106-1]